MKSKFSKLKITFKREGLQIRGLKYEGVEEKT